MEYSYLTFSVVILVFQPHTSLQDCRMTQSSESPQNYWCNTIQELELNGNSALLDVNIYKGDTLPVLKNQTHKKTPHVQVILADEAPQGFSSTTYQVMKNLSHVFLNNNQLRTIPKGLFENLPLQKLRLDNYGIQIIQTGAFSNMASLQELFITRNNLRSIENGIFNGLPVETLALSNNKISGIRRNALQNMKNLKHLHLDGNSLAEFRPDLVLNYVSNLKTLLLQKNGLSEFDRINVKTLDNLKILNLAGNNIRRIVIYAFENLLNLEELDLSSNQLLELEADIFAVDGMPSLTKLDLNDNKLSYLTPKFLGRLDELKYIRIGGNPWTCPCFDAILKWLSDHGIQQFCDKIFYTGTRPVCVVPDVRSNLCDYTATSIQLVNRFSELVVNKNGNNVCSI